MINNITCKVQDIKVGDMFLWCVKSFGKESIDFSLVLKKSCCKNQTILVKLLNAKGGDLVDFIIGDHFRLEIIELKNVANYADTNFRYYTYKNNVIMVLNHEK